jgi:hypothetical protein
MSQLTLYGNPITIKSDDVIMEAPFVNMYFSAEELSGSIDIGLNAGHGTGLHNVIIGTRAGEDNTSAYDSVIIGYEAGNSVTTPNNNVLVGKSAAPLLVAATDTTSIGANTATNRTAGNQNTNLGANAGSAGTTGNINLCLGYNAGSVAPTTGTGCILIANNGTAADSLVTRIGSTQSTCYVAGITGVAQTGPTAAVTVNGSGQLGITAASLRELKDDITLVNKEENHAKLMALKPCHFTYKSWTEKITQNGFIIDELEPILPNMVGRLQDGSPFWINLEQLIALLTAEVQFLSGRITQLEAI